MKPSNRKPRRAEPEAETDMFEQTVSVLKVFRKFGERCGPRIAPGSVEERVPPKPVIKRQIEARDRVAI